MVNIKAIDILLAEDNEDDIEITKTTFEGARIRNNLWVVRNGQEALDYLHGRGMYQDRGKYPLPQLMLLDINMPKKDGFETLEEMKKDDRLKLIPVTMLTSSKNEQDIVHSYKSGVVAYIAKPVTYADFMEVVNHFNFFWQIVELPRIQEE